MFAVTSRFEERAGAIVGGPLHKAMLLLRDRDLQRATGAARIVLISRDGVTCASDVFQKSPLRVLFPRIDGNSPNEAVIANTSGGIAGGDTYVCEAVACAGTAMTVTTQAAEKVYRAIDSPASIATRLAASDGAKLAWLPQETILFDGARLHRNTEIELERGAEILALEWLVLGRAARGETMRGGDVRDSWRVRLDGRLLWADSFRLAGDIWGHAHRAPLLDGCIALATLLYFGPRPAERLGAIREALTSLPCRSGATQIAGLIIVRFASPLPANLRLGLNSFLQQFSAQEARNPFRVPKMWSC